MVLGEEVETCKDDAPGDNNTSQVSNSTDELTDKVDALSAALISHDKLLKHAAHNRKEYKEKLEVVLKELEFAKSFVIVFEESECDACAVHMSNLATLQTKYASLLDELNEVKARPVMLGACKCC